MPRPVRRVVLDESHPRRLIIWILLSLAIAAGAFFAFFQGLLRVAPGWTAIPSEGRYAREITLRYELGAGKDAPAGEQKKLQRIFTLALDQAGQALDASEVFEEPRNLAWLNAHPNVETEVSPILYRALEAALSAGRCQHVLRHAFPDAVDDFCARLGIQDHPRLSLAQFSLFVHPRIFVAGMHLHGKPIVAADELEQQRELLSHRCAAHRRAVRFQKAAERPSRFIPAFQPGEHRNLQAFPRFAVRDLFSEAPQPLSSPGRHLPIAERRGHENGRQFAIHVVFLFLTGGWLSAKPGFHR